MSSIPVLSLIPRGRPEHPRFLIANQHQQVWTGDGWSDAENDGLLFATVTDAGRVSVEILNEATEGKPRFKFVAPVEVEIRGDDPPDLTELMLWLMRAARLFTDYRQPGLSDATAILSIDWTELKEVSE